MDNIRYGSLMPQMKVMKQRIVRADEFIRKMENYYTEVKRGSPVTGARQLISFARALLADPRILIWMRQPPVLYPNEILVQKGLERC